MDFVLGFIHWHSSVLLIEKNRPEWQAGLYNGLGGKIHPGENPLDAMIREVKEEAGVTTEGWRQFAELVLRDGGKVFCFELKMQGNQTTANFRTMTDEKVVWCFINRLHPPLLVSNLQWLLGMALDTDRPSAVITYPGML